MSAKCQKPTSERQLGFVYYSHKSPAIFPTLQVWFNIALSGWYGETCAT